MSHMQTLLARIVGARPHAPTRHHDHWTDKAECTRDTYDPDTWFSDAKDSIDLARMICDQCPVRVTCLERALRLPLADDRWGIRGGLTAEERARMRRAA